MAFVGLDRPPVEPSSDDLNGKLSYLCMCFLLKFVFVVDTGGLHCFCFCFFYTVTAKDTEVMIIVQVLKFQASVMA